MPIFTSVYDRKYRFCNEVKHAFKIAAFEMQNSLLNEIVKTKKPLIISCGMTNLNVLEIWGRFSWKHNSNIFYYNYVSSYPLEKHSNLNDTLIKRKFNCPIGHSDLMALIFLHWL